MRTDLWVPSRCWIDRNEARERDRDARRRATAIGARCRVRSGLRESRGQEAANETTAVAEPSIGSMAEKPLGPRDLDLAAMTDEDFQQMCHRLVLLEHPAAVSTDNPDSGADSLLPNPKDGWEEAWQVKRYGGTIYWSKCKDSLDRAIGTYEIDKMTFCFPRNLTKGQHKKFNQELVSRHDGVEVGLWDRDKLLAMLNGSEEGQRIVVHFFGEDPQNKEPLLRAIRAGGELETAEDAFERARPIGDFLARDPFFRYPQFTHEVGDDAPPLSKGTMISVSSTEQDVTVRVDAVPRDEDAARRFAPALSIGFTDDEEGVEAARRFNDAIERGRPVSIDKGVEVTPNQMPPLFAEHVGEKIRASVSIKPNIPPWNARVEAITDRGHELLDMRLELAEEIPDDWDIRMSAFFGGLSLSVLMRWREHGEINITYRYSFDESPARDQARTLRFVLALLGKGEMVITDVDGDRPELRQETEEQDPDENLLGLLEFLENMVVIEDWIGQRIDLPDHIDSEDAQRAALFAAVIKERSMPVKWENARAQMPPESVAELKSGKEIKIVQDIGGNLLGEEIPLAVGSLVLPEVEVRDLGPLPDDQELHQVEMVPPDGEPTQLAWSLEPPGTRHRS